jgi:hypothetical protein
MRVGPLSGLKAEVNASCKRILVLQLLLYSLDLKLSLLGPGKKIPGSRTLLPPDPLSCALDFLSYT